ncbi:MAG: MiaB/RimO family radical SAM methylthiotransferase [Elusimicrobiales bacterium]|nr:MiaB/RimO family radical SAM methylthiotransferase [Elusimicrobiales bacterium]
MKIYFKSFGCKTNQIEIESLKQHLILKGFVVCDKNPDFFVINSCCVTENAEKDVIKFLKKVLKENPSSLIIFTGCLATLKWNEFKEQERIKVFSNSEKHLIYNFLTEDKKDISFFPIIRLTNKTRAFIKVQDGCDMECSYCIVSKLRSVPKSKSIFSIIDEVKNLISLGVKEIVLSGTRLGSYKDSGKNFADLVCEIIKIPGNFRIRYSSLEPWEIDEYLIEVSQDSKICKYFHIPLQSGSDKILSLMKRPYNKSFFEDRINLIRKKIDNVGIYSDIIVGFPEESEVDYLETEKFVKDICLSGLHVFTFSKRPNTEAFSKNDLPKNIKEDRSNNMREVDKLLRKKFISSKIGNKMEVLTMKIKNGIVYGLSSEFIDVITEDNVLVNEFYYLFGSNIRDRYLVCVKNKF